MDTEHKDIDDTQAGAAFSDITGNYEDWFDRNTVAVVLAPDVARVFPNADSVNQALHILIQAAQLPPPTRPMLPEAGDEYDDDIPDEIDFSHGVRGKHASWFPEDAVLVVLAPNVARFFSGAGPVNDALRILIQAAQDAVGQATVS